MKTDNLLLWSKRSRASIFLLVMVVSLYAPRLAANTFLVSSQSEFNGAHATATANDSIVWVSGVFSDILLNISKDDLYVGTQTLGGTVFNGNSRVVISGDYVTLEGMQFVGGDIGTENVINTSGSYGLFNEINIRAYTCYKYLRIREASRFCRVTYCNFENRLNMADQNILSILVDDNEPGYHKVQYCSFKNFAGSGNDMGVEPIRIGVSTQADFISRDLVEYCYFTQCDGDGELISSKATQTVYRYNTFENNSKAELVLRHGSEGIVYSNFFLSNKGGVRVREGQDHYIYNNYFYDIDDRPIFLQNDPSDPLDNINIAFNTVLDSEPIRLGGPGDFAPTNVTFANNIFASPQEEVFEDATGTESWIGNISQAPLGIPMPSTGIVMDNPELEANSLGFFGLGENSPAINAAQPGFATLPQFEGMDPIDTDILLDLMRQNRPTAIEQKDLGCSEYPQGILIQPFATEANTGPHYNTDEISNALEVHSATQQLLKVAPNPVADRLTIFVNDAGAEIESLEILDLNGKLIRVLPAARASSFTTDVSILARGVYLLKAVSQADGSSPKRTQVLRLVKL